MFGRILSIVRGLFSRTLGKIKIPATPKFVKSGISSLAQAYSGRSPLNFAMGAGIGSFLGLLPTMAPPNFLAVPFFLLFSFNGVSFLIAFLFFKVVAIGFEPLLDAIGYWVLTGIAPLKEFFIFITTHSILPLFLLRNTVVMGSMVFGTIVGIPIFISTYIVARVSAKPPKKKVQNEVAA